MEYRVVPMTPAHLDQVAELERICFPEDPWSRRLFEEALEGETTGCFAAVGGSGTVLGYLVFTAVLDEGSVDNVAVRPGCRRQGVASALLAAFHQFGRENGLTDLFLEVRASNRSAIALYTRHGYAEAGRRKNYYLSPREDAIIMRMELTDGTENTDP